MNTPNSFRQPEKASPLSDRLFALLVVIALFQIALCLGASSGLVDHSRPAPAISESLGSQTNAPMTGELQTVSGFKIPGFPSGPTRS